MAGAAILSPGRTIALVSTITHPHPNQNISDAITLCAFSFLLVSWTVVNSAPAAFDSLAIKIGAPQCGQLAALSETSFLHSLQLINAIALLLA